MMIIQKGKNEEQFVEDWMMIRNLLESGSRHCSQFVQQSLAQDSSQMGQDVERNETGNQTAKGIL
jgi:hypothetical protein